MAFLISGGGGNRLPGLPAMPCAQVATHHVDDHGREHQEYCDPETRASQRAFPIRTGVMMIAAIIRVVVRVVAVLYFIHCFPSLSLEIALIYFSSTAFPFLLPLDPPRIDSVLAFADCHRDKSARLKDGWRRASRRPSGGGVLV